MSRGTNLWKKFEQNAGRPFGDAAIKYLTEFDGKDLSRQQYALRAVLPYLEGVRIIDVNNDALRIYKEDRKAGRGAFDKPSMVGTINKELTTVTTVLNCACRDWQWIPSVPRIRHVKGARRVSYALTWDEQDRLFAYLPDRWARGAALFAVNTGVRKAELFGLKWKDMQEVPTLDTFVFILTDTKNGKDRAVICNSEARKSVDSQRDNGSLFVFPSASGRTRGRMVTKSNRVWRDAWEMANLPSDPLIRKGIHNCRHTYGHRLRSCDVPEEDRDALLGHNKANLSQHYAAPALERLTEMSERVTERKDTVVLRGY